MTLQRQTIRFPMGVGVDTKTDKNQLPLGKLVALENATFETPKKLRKRPAQNLLTPSPVTAGALAAFVRDDDELLMVDGNNIVNSYAGEVTPAAPWTPKGLLPSVTATVQPLGTTQYSTVDVDLAKSPSGLICSVFLLFDQNNTLTLLNPTAKGLAYSILDSNTGSVLVPPRVFDSLPSSILPRVVYANGNFCIYWIQGADYTLGGTLANTIVGSTISVAAPTTPPAAPTAITSGSTSLAMSIALSRQVYDAKANADFGAVYISFANRLGSLTTMRLADTAPLVVAAAIQDATPTPQSVALAFDETNSNVMVAWTDATTANSYSYTVYSFALTTTLVAATTIAPSVPSGFVFTRITAISKFGSAVVFASGLKTSSGADIRTQAIYSTALSGSNLSAVGTKTKLIGSLSIGGQAFVAQTTFYVPAWFYASGGRDSQAALYVIDTQGNVVASSLRGTCGATASITDFSSTTHDYISACGSTIVDGTMTIVICAQAMTTRLNSSTSDFNDVTTVLSGTLAYQYGPAAATFNFLHGSASEFMSAEIAQTLHISGSVPYMYDGTNSVEHGFLQYPWDILTVARTGSGGLTALATYSWAVTYEWMDALGHVHRSTPGIIQPNTITLTTGQNNVDIVIPTLRCTQKTNVQITVWRTLANGSVYFQVNNFNQFGTLYNDKSLDIVTWNDGVSDSQLLSAPQLYTTGGVLSNSPPNPIGPEVVHRNRIFAVDSTNPLVIQYTQLVVNPAPAEWSPFNVMNVDPRGGDVTALGSMDDKLIVAKMNRLFVVYGQGPDATGAQNDFSDTLPVTTDTGCDSPKSMVNVPDGLMFHSPKGFYLLNRALQMQYIGYDVDAFNSDVVLGAEVMPDRHQIRFTTRDMTAGVTRQLVYDYVVGQWSVYVEPIPFVIYGNAVGSVIWQGRLVLGRIRGYALIEDLPANSTFADVSSYIPMKIQTGWLSFADIQGQERLYKIQIFGTFKSPHQLIVSLAFDSKPISQVLTIDVPASIVPYQLAIKPSQQRCQSVQITIQDSIDRTTNVPGEGFDFSSLAMEFGVQGKLRLLGKGRSYG